MRVDQARQQRPAAPLHHDVPGEHRPRRIVVGHGLDPLAGDEHVDVRPSGVRHAVDEADIPEEQAHVDSVDCRHVPTDLRLRAAA